jgi:hypothetical protein
MDALIQINDDLIQTVDALIQNINGFLLNPSCFNPKHGCFNSNHQLFFSNQCTFALKYRVSWGFFLFFLKKALLFASKGYARGSGQKAREKKLRRPGERLSGAAPVNAGLALRSRCLTCFYSCMAFALLLITVNCLNAKIIL